MALEALHAQNYAVFAYFWYLQWIVFRNDPPMIEDLAPSDDFSPFTVLGTSLGGSSSKEAFTLKVSKVILLYKLYVE